MTQEDSMKSGGSAGSAAVTFRALDSGGFARQLERLLLPHLVRILERRQAGHCMRVADLEADVMQGLCVALRQRVPGARIYLLGTPGEMAPGAELFVSSTKLVELRNEQSEGAPGAPLLVFLPPKQHTSAEDSFGVATFEEIDLLPFYGASVQTLLEEFPPALQGTIAQIFHTLQSGGQRWLDHTARLRYLMTLQINGADEETVGAALYELGLIPDFRLLERQEAVRQRLHRNQESVQKLTLSDATVRGRVDSLHLTDSRLRRDLASYLTGVDRDRPLAWTRPIATDRARYSLSFDKWPFEDALTPDTIRVNIEKTDLPIATGNENESRLHSLVGQQFCLPRQQKKMSVTISTDAPPSRIQGLSYFLFEILYTGDGDGSPIGVSKKHKVWAGERKSASVNLTRLDKAAFEEGWHIVRVTPCTENGDPVPQANGEGRKPPYDSEPFFVVPEGEDASSDNGNDRRAATVASLEHARILAGFDAIGQGNDGDKTEPTAVTWTVAATRRNVATKKSSGDYGALTFRFSGSTAYQCAVAPLLRQWERRILEAPETAAIWRLDLRNGENSVSPEALIPWEVNLPSVREFLDARAEYFRSVSGETELVTQGADLRSSATVASRYGTAYLELIHALNERVKHLSGPEQGRATLALRLTLSLDTARILTDSGSGRRQGEVALLGPTHPLRAAQLAGWTQLAQDWMRQLREVEGLTASIRELLLTEFAPIDIPAFLVLPDGRLLCAVDNIHPFYQIFASPGEEDARGLISSVCRSLELPEPPVLGAAVDGALLASRLARYLTQYPYIHTLTINVFNPGGAQSLADALVMLQKQEAFADLRYDLRLFVLDPGAPGVGAALERLLAPERAGSREEVDAFARSTESALFPKLRLAIRPFSRFREVPEEFRAHLSLLFDLFPAQYAEVSPAFPNANVASPVHALVQGFLTRYEEGGTHGEARWLRQPQHGPAHPLGRSPLPGLLAGLQQAFSEGLSVAARASAGDLTDRPTLRLSLTPEQKSLLFEVHEVSDWVLTLDRNLGIEYFDHGHPNRPHYLVDYAPASEGRVEGHKLIVTSRSLAEIESRLLPTLQQANLAAAPDAPARLLAGLRSLSGRLTLKLASAQSQQYEALGLALAHRFLETEGALTNQVILPLDAHQDLFQSARAQTPGNGDVSLQRTDLAVIDLNEQARSIRFNLVEVKCRKAVNTDEERAELVGSITQQITRTEKALRHHFDPTLHAPDRPDRLLQSQRFSRLLRFYIERARRYRHLDAAADAEAEYLAATLEGGYNIEFRRAALIFALASEGHPTTYAADIEFHWLGRREIEALLGERTAATASHESAVYLAPPRDRTRRSHSEDSLWEYAPVVRTHPPVAVPMERPSEGLMPDGSDPIGQTDDTATSTHQGRRDGRSGTGNSDGPLIEILSEPAVVTGPACDILLGTNQPNSKQFGILGDYNGRTVGIDLNLVHTISLFGVQGGGKSYTLGSIIEMACLAIPGVNLLPRPLATIVFHYSPTMDYAPEFTTMTEANSEASQIAALRERFGADPKALTDVLLLAPTAQVEARKREYPDIQVAPIAFASSELKAAHWRFLMGAVGNQSLYVRQIHSILRNLRDQATLGRVQEGIEHSELTDPLKNLARTRLKFAAEYIADEAHFKELVRPGRLIIVDLRDEFIEKDEALGLFIVLLQLFSEAQTEDGPFNKLVVFDEAHKYISSPELVADLIGIIREMRHKGTSVLVASQDPMSVPQTLIELSSLIILHKMTSPAWLRHIQRTNVALSVLQTERLSQLGPGEAYIWSREATDSSFSRGAIKIRCRPRVTLHGGATRTAL